MKKILSLSIILIFGVISATSQPCLPEGITFNTQAQIDGFQILHPNCTEIEGDVSISGADITNLNGLNVLTSIQGTLSIQHNNALPSLSGLDNVTSIGGYLWIEGNDALTSLSGLDNVTSIGGSLDILYNIALPSLSGLEGLTSLGGGLWIGYNDSLTSLTALDNVTSIGIVWIMSNPVLPSLSGLDNVTSIGESLYINDNVALTSLSELDNVTSIGEGLYIGYNDSLTSLTGLDNVTSIGGYLYITDNVALTSLSGLEGLTSFGGGIKIVNNDSLTSLTALDNVTSIGEEQELWIGYNDALTSLSGLDNINPESIEFLNISENQWLSDCAILSICNYLENPNVTIGIINNTTGCNSAEEVQDSCVANAVSVEELNLKNRLLIYPNPTSSEITISGIDGVIDEISIYNRLGQRVIYAVATDNNLDVSILPPGLYVIEVAWDRDRVRQKLIVQ